MLLACYEALQAEQGIQKGPSRVAPRLIFGSFTPEHAKLADVHVSCKPSLSPCKENSTEEHKEQLKNAQKSAAHHGFRDLLKLIFKVYLHYFISLGLSHCQEKEKGFCKFLAEKNSQ